MMKKFLTLITAALLLSVTLATTAAAQGTPELYPVQGFLTDASGDPIEGQIDLRFRLYDTTETVIHQESIEVTVTAGSFSAYLGSEVALSPALFAQHSEIELGIKVGTDEEMSPRITVGSVPYAARAASAQIAELADFADAADTALHADVATTVEDAIPVYRVTNTFCEEAPGTLSFSDECVASQHRIDDCQSCSFGEKRVRTCNGTCACITNIFVACPPPPLVCPAPDPRHNLPRCDNTPVGQLVPN